VVVKTERFELRLDEDTVARIDNWRALQADLPSRAEAMRRLVELGIGRSQHESVRFTDGEKLLLLMMRDLYRHLHVTNAESDPEFIAEVIFGGHFWAPKWKLLGVFHDHEDDPRDLHWVLNVLDMWDRIEAGYERLSKKDRIAIARDAAPLGEHVRFPGFDGNNEAAALGIASFLVNKMERFSRFAKRDLNSHLPTRDTYQRMLKVFEPMRKNLVGRELGAAQITELLKAEFHPDRRSRAGFESAEDA
jgi:uncharacterized protein YfbU (UPF0304 family)